MTWLLSRVFHPFLVVCQQCHLCFFMIMTKVYFGVSIPLILNASCSWLRRHSYVNLFRRGRSKMEFFYFFNLIFIFVLNVFFFFSGICLNSVVIITYWRSVQLPKKLCYFMITVLSCCDLLVVLTNIPPMALVAILGMTGKLDVNAEWVRITSQLTHVSVVFSFLALLVMNFDRYLATSYPIFHRTSVTKRRLSTLLGILMFIDLTLAALSLNDSIIPFHVYALIILILLTPPTLYINYKLLKVVRRNRRNNGLQPNLKKSFSLKNVSSCLLAVACFMVLSIPVIIYAALRMTQTTLTLDNAYLAACWGKTFGSMNSTLNCLIFYWKNKILRTEGWKVIKSMKIWRWLQSWFQR